MVLLVTRQRRDDAVAPVTARWRGTTHGCESGLSSSVFKQEIKIK